MLFENLINNYTPLLEFIFFLLADAWLIKRLLRRRRIKKGVRASEHDI